VSLHEEFIGCKINHIDEYSNEILEE